MEDMDAYEETLTNKYRLMLIFGLVSTEPIIIVIKTFNSFQSVHVIVDDIAYHTPPCLLRKERNDHQFAIFKILKNGSDYRDF